MEGDAQLLLLNGSIYPGPDWAERHEALLLEGNRVRYVGDASTARLNADARHTG